MQRSLITLLAASLAVANGAHLVERQNPSYCTSSLANYVNMDPFQTNSPSPPLPCPGNYGGGKCCQGSMSCVNGICVCAGEVVCHNQLHSVTRHRASFVITAPVLVSNTRRKSTDSGHRSGHFLSLHARPTPLDTLAAPATQWAGTAAAVPT